VVAGQTHLMQCADLSDLDKLRQLFEAFNHKRDCCTCLTNAFTQRGCKSSSAMRPVLMCWRVQRRDSALQRGRAVLGVLGVIGPTRMAYDRVIPVVDVTARLLAAALNARKE
jgi:heat-inducible transcriptional repressor